MAPVMNQAASPAGREPTESSATTVRLSENLDAHESSLSSHLDLVESIDANNNMTTPRTVSRILESAQKLVDQFTTLRKQLTSIGIGTTSASRKDSADPRNSREKLKARKPFPTTKISGKGMERNIDGAESTTSEGGGRKRSRESDFSESQVGTHQGSQSSRKRSRTKREISGAQDDVEDFVPVALQKDDISEEVERRLKLKEERRKKSSAESDKKRRRDSTSSRNGSPSSWSSKNRTKRSKNSNYGDGNE